MAHQPLAPLQAQRQPGGLDPVGLLDGHTGVDRGGLADLGAVALGLVEQPGLGSDLRITEAHDASAASATDRAARSASSSSNRASRSAPNSSSMRL